MDFSTGVVLQTWSGVQCGSSVALLACLHEALPVPQDQLPVLDIYVHAFHPFCNL